MVDLPLIKKQLPDELTEEVYWTINKKTNFNRLYIKPDQENIEAHIERKKWDNKNIVDFFVVSKWKPMESFLLYTQATPLLHQRSRKVYIFMQIDNFK